MIKLKITVTKEILEKSKLCLGLAAENCAIALAVRGVFPKAVVGLDAIFLCVFERDPKIALPEEAKEFISEFDCLTPAERVNMNPISFEIEIPDAVIDRINIDELRPLLVNHPTLEIVNN